MVAILLIGGSTAGIIIPVRAETETNNSDIIYSNATIEDDFAPDSLLVVLNNETSLKFKTYSPSDFSEIKAKDVSHITTFSESRAQKAIKSVEAAVASRSVFVTVDAIDLSKYKQVLCIELEDTGKDKVLDAIKELEKRDDVLYVGPDYYLEPCSDTSTLTYEAYFEDQWAYDSIELGDALDEIDTSTEVLVGILDSGIDDDHPDLENRIDRLLSCDFANDDYDPLEDDDNFGSHGTNVAGIIAGICENAKLVSLKIMEGITANTIDRVTAKYRSSYACRAIEYAEENDIMILNMSVGWVGSSANGEFDNDRYDEAMCSVLDQYSGLLICSAGNDFTDIDDNDAQWDVFPQQYCFANLLVVGASTQDDRIWYNADKNEGSNYGETSVDLFAPGVSIRTIVEGGGRSTMSGTSAAAPVVAGVAALMLSAVPNLTADDIASIFRDPENVDPGDPSAFEGKCVSEGRLNALKAVEAALDSCHHPDADTYYVRTTSTHKLCCSICNKVISTEAHGITYTSVDSESHSAYCAECNYSVTEDHDLYVASVYNDIYTIQCHECSYSFNCNCDREYESDGATGHYVNCLEGCFSNLEPHIYETTGEYNSSGHEIECVYCDYIKSVSHDLYMYSEDTEDYVVKCYECNYTVECWESPEYFEHSDYEHWVGCPDGCYSFYEPHTPGSYVNTGEATHDVVCDDCGYVYSEDHTFGNSASSYNSSYHFYQCIDCGATGSEAHSLIYSDTDSLYTHSIECRDCDYQSTENHNWIRRGTGYLCTICGQSEAFIPSVVMSLPNPELRIYLASLSDEELDSFIASLPEDQLDRVTELLPPENDDELSGE